MVYDGHRTSREHVKVRAEMCRLWSSFSHDCAMNIRLVNPDSGGKAAGSYDHQLTSCQRGRFPLQWIFMQPYAKDLQPPFFILGCGVVAFYRSCLAYHCDDCVMIVRQNPLTSDVPYREYPRACLPLSLSPGMMFRVQC